MKQGMTTMHHALAFQAVEKSPTPKLVSNAKINVSSAQITITAIAANARICFILFIFNSLVVIIVQLVDAEIKFIFMAELRLIFNNNSINELIFYCNYCFLFV